MRPRIAIYGGSFSPPGQHHRRIAELLAREFDRVIVVPCGPRPDKQVATSVDPIYRAAMTDIAFRGLRNVDVELFDLEQATFTRTHDLETRFASRGDLWHVVGTDLVAGGREGQSFIHRVWERGPELWRTLRFAVVNRRGHEAGPGDLPPQHRLVNAELEGSSFHIREMLFRREEIRHCVSPEIAAYIERQGLYCGTFPRRVTKHAFKDGLRPLLAYDERNPKAVAWAREFEKHGNHDEPNCILVFGGDGSMLHAIQKHWRKRVPFFGINAGHLGFLLNDYRRVVEEGFPDAEIVLRQMPMLYVEMQAPDGSWRDMLTFNDAWVERKSGQTAWLGIKVNGQTRIEKMVCDGVLVSTAAGSTAYARAMGATPLLADTPAWLLAGSNVLTPAHWKSALLSMDASVEIESLDYAKRPLQGYVYGVEMGEVRGMRARVSRIAAAELAFCANHDMAEKIAHIQFPRA
ncbi:MAG: NAD(+)/NADH kinase [Planctomycetota bacterium]|nr:NAD(+)/NADH kinase [Planctomycetota bacterium]